MKQCGTRFSDGTVKCPFCDFSTDETSANQACGNCYVEFYLNRCGAVIFDTERRTENSGQYAFARCFAGMRIGRLEEECD